MYDSAALARIARRAQCGAGPAVWRSVRDRVTKAPRRVRAMGSCRATEGERKHGRSYRDISGRSKRRVWRIAARPERTDGRDSNGMSGALRRPGGDRREGSWSGALLRVRRDGRGIWKHEGQDAEGERGKEDRKTGEAQAKRIAAQPKRGTKTGRGSPGETHCGAAQKEALRQAGCRRRTG